METLEDIVKKDSKQRYSFSEDKRLIRANQGHSISVDVELEEKAPPDVLWHGTGEKYVSSIESMGLIPKGRLYVHLSSDVATAKKVGSRHGRPVIFKVDSRRMAGDGFPFYLSANGVWLTREVPRRYLQKVDVEKNRLLFYRQKETLDLFLERGAISQAQFEKSLGDLSRKMGI